MFLNNKGKIVVTFFKVLALLIIGGLLTLAYLANSQEEQETEMFNKIINFQQKEINSEKTSNCDEIINIGSFAGLTSEDNLCVAKLVAKTMLKETPMKADSMTTLTSVIAIENLLLYKYVIELPKEIDITKTAALMNENVVNSNCTTPEVREIIDLDVLIEHNYADKNGKFLFKVEVDKNKCESLK